MLRILGFLAKEKIRRIRKLACHNRYKLLAGLIGFVFCIWSLLSDLSWTGMIDMNYVIWIGNIYFLLKILNPTQGMTISYQCIELKLISSREFKVLIGVKLYAGSILLLCLYWFILSEQALLLLALLNGAVNVYVFLRNRCSARLLDLVLALCCCVCVYLHSLLLSLILFLLTTLVFAGIKRMNYDELLPLYRMMYKIGERYTGIPQNESETQELAQGTEQLLGKRKHGPKEWAPTAYEHKTVFYIRKEMARIYANKDNFIVYFIIAIVINSGTYFLPGWYDLLAVILVIIAALNFCTVMNQPDIRLFSYGFIEEYRLSAILKMKWPVYSAACMVLMLPLVVIVKTYFWLIPAAAALVSLSGLLQSFLKPVWKRRKSNYSKKNERVNP